MLLTNIPVIIQELYSISSGGVVGIAARGQIYMSVPLGVVEIHLPAKLPRVKYWLEREIDQWVHKGYNSSHHERATTATFHVYNLSSAQVNISNKALKYIVRVE